MESKSVRIPVIDVARGVALLAMTIYHFAWDLDNFGWLLSGTIAQPGWIAFARSIAASFLFLVGVSLWLAHGDGIRWRGFLVRLAQVVAAAALITLVTWWTDPRTFIFFGILHAIALFSVAALAFLRLPWWLCAVVAVLIFLVPDIWRGEIFAHPALRWVGLAPVPPVSNDFVPFFPWFAATLAGPSAAKLATAMGWWPRLSRVRTPTAIARPTTFIGRHSLLYYLAHQPVMIALLWLFTTYVAAPDRTASFLNDCQRQCVAARGEAACTAYCGCVADALKTADLFTPLMSNSLPASDEAVQGIVRQCSASQ